MSLFSTDLQSLETLAGNGLELPAMSVAPVSATPSSTPSTPTTSNAPSTSTPSSGGFSSLLNLGRFVAIALGLIAIAGSIFLFKSPEVLQAGVKAAKTGALA